MKMKKKRGVREHVGSEFEIRRNLACGAPDGSKNDNQASAFKWQPGAYLGIKGARLRLMTAPTGSGKGHVIIMLGMRDLHDGHKVIVSVPQRDIGRNFARPFEDTLPDGIHGKWHPGTTITTHATDKVDTLVAFLQKKPLKGDYQGNTLICTHAALVAAFKKLMAMGGKILKTSIFIDEAHHSRVGVQDRDVNNGIGALVQHYLDEDPGPLTLVTATWMRSVGQIVGDQACRFSAGKFTYHMDEHLNSIFGHDGASVRVKFVMGDALECLGSLVTSDPTRKRVVFLPRRVGGKEKMPYLARCKAVVGKVSSCDLVNLEDRDGRRTELGKQIDAGTAPDLLWSFNLCVEGFDYPALSQVILMEPRGSMLETLQILGRMLRAHAGKTDIELVIVVPTMAADPERMGDYLKIMFASLVVEWQFKKAELIKHLTEHFVRKGRTQDQAQHLARQAAEESPGNVEGSLGEITDNAIICGGDQEKTHKRAIADIQDKGKRIGSEFLGSEDGAEAMFEGADFFARASIRRQLKDAKDVPLELQLERGVIGLLETLTGKIGAGNLKKLREDMGRREFRTFEDDVRTVYERNKRSGAPMTVKSFEEALALAKSASRFSLNS